MGRKKQLAKSLVISVRFEAQEYQHVMDIANLETIATGKKTSAQQLIRDAISYVYGDNERMRECFRRSRKSINTRRKAVDANM